MSLLKQVTKTKAKEESLYGRAREQDRRTRETSQDPYS